MIKKLILAVVALLVLFVFAVSLYVWRNPVKVFANMERRELAKSFAKITVDSPTGKLTLFESGSGPVLILLHGAGDQAGGWSKIAPELAKKYRVIIPDLPGHGESEPASGALSMGTILKGVDTVVARAGDQPVTIIGNSMGGWLAMLYSEKHPERVVRIIAVNGGALRGRTDITLLPKDRNEAAALMKILRDPGSPEFPGWVLDDVVRNAHNGPIGRMYKSGPEIENYLMDGKLQNLKTPTELVWGEADQMLSVDYARRMEQELPAARLSLLPRCGHVPVRECPVGLGNKLREVLELPPPAAKAPPEPAREVKKAS